MVECELHHCGAHRTFLLHGGPHAADEDRFSASRALWLDAGFAVVHVNYRGSTGYGSRWRDAIEGRPRLSELDDIAAIHDWAITSGFTDPARCVVEGCGSRPPCKPNNPSHPYRSRPASPSCVNRVAARCADTHEPLRQLRSSETKRKFRYQDGLIVLLLPEGTTGGKDGVEMAPLTRTQLICAAMLGALLISCGAPPVSAVAPPAPQGAQAPAAEPQPQAEREQPAEQAPAGAQNPGAQNPAAAEPGPASRPRGGLAQAAEPGSKAQVPDGVQRRPSGNAPGVGHGIPQESKSDYADKADWEKAQRQACRDALGRGHDNCVTLRYQWFKEDESGNLDLNAPIHDPTPNYSNYDSCLVRHIDPPNDGSLVPPNTRITIQIGCYSPDTQPPDQQQPGSDQNKTGTQNGSTTSGQQPDSVTNDTSKPSKSHQSGTSRQQPATNKGKHSTENRSGG